MRCHGSERLAQRGLPEAALNDICIGNYARIVEHTMNGATRMARAD